jgi:hypothetical protein
MKTMSTMTQIKPLKPSSEIVQNALKTIPQNGFLGKTLKPSEKPATYTLDELTDNTMKQFPEDINSWTRRTLVHYYAFKHLEVLKVPFQINWQTDLGVIKKIAQFLAANSLNEMLHTKQLIDWAFEHRDMVMTRHQSLHLRVLPKLINYYLPDTVRVKEEDVVSEPEWDDESDKATIATMRSQIDNRLNLFADFGIPLTVTLLISEYRLQPAKIYERLNEIIKVAGQTPTSLQRVKRMTKNSIEMGPYPSSFKGLDWREQLPLLAKKFAGETWWTNEDAIANNRTVYLEIVKKHE